jgi:hypothetical protein
MLIQLRSKNNFGHDKQNRTSQRGAPGGFFAYLKGWMIRARASVPCTITELWRLGGHFMPAAGSLVGTPPQPGNGLGSEKG